MLSAQVKKDMTSIIMSLRAAGYDPLTQIQGYVQTGDLAYITRHGDARNLIANIDMNAIKKFLEFYVNDKTINISYR